MAKEILHHHEIARNSRELSARKEDFRKKKTKASLPRLGLS